MASTIDSSTLTVRISEEIELNGKKLGNSNIHKITGINETSERILTAATDGTTVIGIGDSAAACTFVRGNLKYVRITNLDDTNFVRLAIISSGTDVHVKVPALDSFILSTGNVFAGADAASITFDNITSIKAYADTAAVDVELFVATT